MIVLFTDFGFAGPYVGEMKAAIWGEHPAAAVVDLMHDAPRFSPRPAAYLLAALAARLLPGTICLGVVDPGVGSERLPVIVEADGVIYVGPNNGLFHVVAQRATKVERKKIIWRPASLSATFHGRDLFAPVAARLSKGAPVAAELCEAQAVPGAHWPEELPEAIYIDAYGNVMTGIRASGVAEQAALRVGGHSLSRARTFDDVAPGEMFWYENSCGLVELAMNRGAIAERLGIAIGEPVTITPPA